MGSEKIGPFCKYLNKAMQIWKIKISPSSLATKDCWVVTPENWVSKQILFTELGLYVRLSHPKAMSRLKKVSCKVGISKKPKLHVRSSLLKDKTKFDQPPYIGSPESKDCRVVKPGNWVCKLNFRLELGLYMGLSPQRQCLNWQSPLV